MRRASILAALVFAACGGETDNGSRLVVLLTDAPGEFQKVPLEITAVQARFAGASVQNRSEYQTAATAGTAAQTQSGAQGDAAKQQQGGAGDGEGEWIRIMEQTQQHDLLQLQNGKTAALGDMEIAAGYYDRLRLKVAKMQVVVDGQTHELQVPAEGIEVAYKFQAEAGKGQEMVLDFDAKQSIHQNAAGGYELSPVIEVKQLRYTYRYRTCEGDGECTAGEQTEQQQQAQPEACQGETCAQPTDPAAECQGDACQPADPAQQGECPDGNCPEEIPGAA